ncbi:MAG: hypothetical protein QP780_01950 [Brevibacterium sp. UMB1308B]|nr:hypothetical protein [Brevibacterium sp. UMB1308B]
MLQQPQCPVRDHTEPQLKQRQHGFIDVHRADPAVSVRPDLPVLAPVAGSQPR